MCRELAAKALYVLLAVSLTVAPTMNPAVAGVVSTEEAFASEARSTRIDEVQGDQQRCCCRSPDQVVIFDVLIKDNAHLSLGSYR